jgi:hypothetical protein
MATFVLIEWTFRELPEGSPGMNQIREVQRRKSMKGDRIWPTAVLRGKQHRVTATGKA